MNTKDLVISKLIEYFYAIEMYNNVTKEIEDLYYTYAGVHGVDNTAVRGSGSNRDNTLINLSEKTIPLETEKQKYRRQYEQIYTMLHLDTLSDIDYTIIELIYRYKKTYRQIARRVGYADKTVVFRKRKHILENIVKQYERQSD